MEHKVEITALAWRGAGIGRINGKVVFVPFTAPGDEALVRITTEKKKFDEGELLGLVRASGVRSEPVCEVFGRCGGCQWQHIDYQTQIEWKFKIFVETLKRAGGIELESPMPPLPSPRQFNYRSRARIHIDGERWGFFEPGSHRVVDITACPLLDERINITFRALRERFKHKPTSIHSVELALDIVDGMTVASFHVNEAVDFKWDELVGMVEGLKGLEVRLFKGSAKGKRVLVAGDCSVRFRAAGLELASPVSAFTQANPEQNENLVKRVVSIAGFTGAETLLDLYCGSGNLTIPLAAVAGKGSRAVGVDSSAVAVAAARLNAHDNRTRLVGKVEFLCGPAESYETLEKTGPDVVILDPPRGGGLNVVKALARAGPERVIYISCSPPTLARDAAYLLQHGYEIFSAGVIDMFPQSYHIESVLGLKRAT